MACCEEWDHRDCQPILRWWAILSGRILHTHRPHPFTAYSSQEAGMIVISSSTSLQAWACPSMQCLERKSVARSPLHRRQNKLKLSILNAYQLSRNQTDPLTSYLACAFEDCSSLITTPSQDISGQMTCRDGMSTLFPRDINALQLCPTGVSRRNRSIPCRRDRAQHLT